MESNCDLRNWGVKGAGGSEVDFPFFLFLLEENGSYQELFSV